ncbi:ATP-binding domain-containing protein [Formosa sp. Hel1_33_131]|jgi:uncharacterized protein (TIGR00290 family)|uniref:Dph6-related ATP pyrophosphatase n=1 Tax=Formosa sp. Hel1_33_131 TaxID=1336794 RepID=UPI00084E1EDA|nr:diphthine--ammonia ligase [Formosa sp. Hel1_33_131]AOR28817.1 ATP-binding domain-containing protein [Formosa sp. Hel1_33_131]
MTQKLKTYFNWSSGKDASLAFYHMQREGIYSIERLLTSINAHHDRVTMHGLRRELLEQQIKSIGIPVTTVELPEEPSMEDYNQIMSCTVMKLKSDGYSDCGFGDIYLEDLRIFREEKLKPFGIRCHFPLWKRDTKTIINEFIKLGFKAIVICIKSDLLDKSFVGREIDEDFINDLPKNVDPCGENGEFHTFCYDGPIFKKPIKFNIGDKILREYKAPKQDDQLTDNGTIGFWFCDLLPIAE